MGEGWREGVRSWGRVDGGGRMWLSPRTVLLFRMNLHVLPQCDMYHSDTAVCVERPPPPPECLWLLLI